MEGTISGNLKFAERGQPAKPDVADNFYFCPTLVQFSANRLGIWQIATTDIFREGRNTWRVTDMA